MRKKWQSTQAHWDDASFLSEDANALMKLRWRRLSRRCAGRVALAAGRLGCGVDLVDVGCAHADFREACQGSLRTYTGIEPSRALLPRDRRLDAQGWLKRGQAEKLPLKNSCADFVLLKEVLDHCYDPARVLRECFRVLRPGGELLITLTNDHAWYKLLLPTWAARIKAGQHDHLNFFHPQWVKRLTSEAGFAGLGGDDSHYLRLPWSVEQALGSLPEAAGSALISMSDAAGSLIGPDMGGSFWVWGHKP